MLYSKSVTYFIYGRRICQSLPAPLSPLVTVGLFSVSLSLLLLCKSAHSSCWASVFCAPPGRPGAHSLCRSGSAVLHLCHFLLRQLVFSCICWLFLNCDPRLLGMLFVFFVCLFLRFGFLKSITLQKIFLLQLGSWLYCQINFLAWGFFKA